MIVLFRVHLFIVMNSYILMKFVKQLHVILNSILCVRAQAVILLEGIISKKNVFKSFDCSGGFTEQLRYMRQRKW